MEHAPSINDSSQICIGLHFLIPTLAGHGWGQGGPWSVSIQWPELRQHPGARLQLRGPGQSEEHSKQDVQPRPGGEVRLWIVMLHPLNCVYIRSSGLNGQPPQPPGGYPGYQGQPYGHNNTGGLNTSLNQSLNHSVDMGPGYQEARGQRIRQNSAEDPNKRNSYGEITTIWLCASISSSRK